MNRSPENTEESLAFQMIAMVDVVFILLAFFVLSSTFDRPERDFAMRHSKAQALGEGSIAEDFPTYIPVRIRPSGEGVSIAIGQARLGDDDYAAITAKLAEINMPQLMVRIEADPNLTVEQVAKAMDAVLVSPMKKLSVSRLVVSDRSGKHAVRGGE